MKTFSRSEHLKTISKQRTPPVGNLKDVSEYISLYQRKQTKELILNHHTEAEDVQKMMDSFVLNSEKSLFTRRCQTAISDYRTRLSDTTYNLSDIDHAFREKAEETEKIIQKKILNMKEKHDIELSQLLSEEPIKTPVKFRRRSPYLLENIRQERRLFFQSRFDEAEKLRKFCEEEDEKEAKLQNEKAYESWNLKKQNLLKQHQIEEENLNKWIATRRAEIQKEESVVKDSISKREKLLNTEISERSKVMISAESSFRRRNLLFDRSPSGGIPPELTKKFDLYKLSSKLDNVSHTILCSLEN